MADTNIQSLTLICTHCKTEKFITQFKKKITNKSGYTSICKECYNEKESKAKKNRPIDAKVEAQKRYRSTEKYRETAWASHIKRKYNITLEEYESYLISQNYSCKICNSKKANRNWKEKQQRIDLFIDHCHTTGKIRGLLCNKCNIGIAMFSDNLDTLANAMSYLKESKNE